MNQATLRARRQGAAGGFVDNARALPTTPPAHQKQARRTFYLSYKADIFTRSRHRVSAFRPDAPCRNVAVSPTKTLFNARGLVGIRLAALLHANDRNLFRAIDKWRCGGHGSGGFR